MFLVNKKKININNFFFKNIKNFEIRKNTFILKIQNYFDTPEKYNSNNGAIFIIENKYEIPQFIHKTSKKNKNLRFLVRNKLINFNIDSRDLCIKKGEIVQNIRIILVSKHIEENFYNFIEDSGFLFYYSLQRFSLNSFFFQTHRKKIAKKKFIKKNIISFNQIQLYICKKNIKKKLGSNSLSDDFSMLTFLKNNFPKNVIKTCFEKKNRKISRLNIIKGIFLLKSFKVRDFINIIISQARFYI